MRTKSRPNHIFGHLILSFNKLLPTKNQVNFFEGGSINKGEMVHVTIS
jgi:hypothetical protein